MRYYWYKARNASLVGLKIRTFFKNAVAQIPIVSNVNKRTQKCKAIVNDSLTRCERN